MPPSQRQLARLAALEAEAAAASVVAAPPVFLDPLFPEQSAFLEDPSSLKVALCTRRAGKSYGPGGLHLFKDAYETPGVSCLYIGLTRESVKRIMWKDVYEPINDRLGLRGTFNLSELSITLPNRSVIYNLGLDSHEKEKRKVYGQKFKRVVVDEAALFSTDLRQLIYGTLKPGLADLRGGVCLLGMPSNIKKGLFYELTQGQDPTVPGRWKSEGWSGHRWSALQNPYMRTQWLEEIAEIERDRPRFKETPIYEQEYLGRWVTDDTKLVYRFLEGRNTFTELPVYQRGRWHFGLGMDLGHSPDPSAFLVSAYHDHDPVLYFLEAHEGLKMDITDVANFVKGYQKTYDFDSMVIDGANKQAVEEIRRRHALPLVAADKTGKADFIEIMNAEFIQGNIKLHATKCAWPMHTKGAPTSLQEQYGGLIWDDRSSRREEHPASPNHAADAALYNFRKAFAYLSKRIAKPPAHGSPEALAAIEAAALALVSTGARKQQDPIDAEWEFWQR